MNDYDVAIVGGGPAGLAAALVLMRARKRVLLFDGGFRRNEAADRIHGFVTREGITPDKFRAVGREQLAAFAETGSGWCNDRVETLSQTRCAGCARFVLHCAGGVEYQARRVLLATGMIDQLPDLPGLQELWGKGVYLCPYCHGWESRGQPFGFLCPDVEEIEWPLLLRSWTDDVTVFTGGQYRVPEEARFRLESGRVTIEERPIATLARSSNGMLSAVVLDNGAVVPMGAFFVRSRQRQVAFVQRLGLDLHSGTFLQVNNIGQTSNPGIYAAGDCTNHAQSALLAAASGSRIAYAINQDVTLAKLGLD